MFGINRFDPGLLAAACFVAVWSLLEPCGASDLSAVTRLSEVDVSYRLFSDSCSAEVLEFNCERSVHDFQMHSDLKSVPGISPEETEGWKTDSFRLIRLKRARKVFKAWLRCTMVSGLV